MSPLIATIVGLLFCWYGNALKTCDDPNGAKYKMWMNYTNNEILQFQIEHRCCNFDTLRPCCRFAPGTGDCTNNQTCCNVMEDPSSSLPSDISTTPYSGTTACDDPNGAKYKIWMNYTHTEIINFQTQHECCNFDTLAPCCRFSPGSGECVNNQTCCNVMEDPSSSLPSDVSTTAYSGTTAGGIVGGILFFVIICCIIFACRQRRRSYYTSSYQQGLLRPAVLPPAQPTVIVTNPAQTLQPTTYVVTQPQQINPSGNIYTAPQQPQVIYAPAQPMVTIPQQPQLPIQQIQSQPVYQQSQNMDIMPSAPPESLPNANNDALNVNNDGSNFDANSTTLQQ